MSGSDDYLAIVLVCDIEDYERVHRSELSRLPHVARIQSSFAMCMKLATVRCRLACFDRQRRGCRTLKDRTV
ncbi:Lrp/AsnC ligand binding domain-containing protein [Bradyrhizobium sp. 190]|uniref:Lrp/AsnC ligand binding domain-containing protein n=1 Tax=Bradyrhizobium sp. 190 TaxID=2782658 RepID=UPI0035ABD36B